MISQQVLFTPEECDKLISYGKDFRTVGIYKQPETTITMIDEHQELYEMLNSKFVSNTIKKFPLYFKLLRYHEGVYFNLHKDSDGKDDRRKTIIVQLSDPEDYEGGVLILKGLNESIEADRTRGNVIIYPATTFHQVSKVTSGIRYVLVTWLESQHLNLTKTII